MSSWLALAAGKHPDRIAIEGPERALTYGELLAAAASAATALHRLELRAAPVALALPASEDFVIVLHGCLLSGHAAVPIDPRLSGTERAQREAAAAITISSPLGASRSPPPAVAASAPVGDPAVAVLYTSGTTAAAKPVTLSSTNFLASALGSAVALGLDPEERWLCPMPLTHVGGLSIPIRSAIYGTTVVLHAGFDSDALLSDLMDPGRRITVVSLVPTMLARLLDAGLERPPTLRWALLGGGPIGPALLGRAREAGVPVAPSYGMTEACSQIATFGWPLAGVEVALEGTEREIRVRGPIVSDGTRAPDGWLHTGDAGRFDEAGALEIVGRLADTIVSGGENIAPAEVEAVLLDHPDVEDAAVFGRADREWGERVVARVVLRDGTTPSSDRLRAHCAGRIARFKIPKTIEFADRLPRTTAGKLLRRQLA